jgi:hypothetical protein
MSSHRVCHIATHVPDKSLHFLEGTGDEVAMRAHNRITPDESAEQFRYAELRCHVFDLRGKRHKEVPM